MIATVMIIMILGRVILSTYFTGLDVKPELPIRVRLTNTRLGGRE